MKININSLKSSKFSPNPNRFIQIHGDHGTMVHPRRSTAALRGATAAAEAAAVDAEAVGEARRSEKVLVPWGFWWVLGQRSGEVWKLMCVFFAKIGRSLCWCVGWKILVHQNVGPLGPFLTHPIWVGYEDPQLLFFLVAKNMVYSMYTLETEHKASSILPAVFFCHAQLEV